MIKNLGTKAPAARAEGPHISPFDWSELHRAVYAGNLRKIEKLAQDPLELHTRDREGRGVLHVAVSQGNVVALNLLLRAGAHVDAQDVWGVSPLHMAIANDNIAIVKLLINFGANPDIKNDFGETCRRIASSRPLIAQVLQESYGSTGVDAFESLATRNSYSGLVRS